MGIPNQDPFNGLKTTSLLFSGLQMLLALEVIITFWYEPMLSVAFALPAFYLSIHTVVFMSMTHVGKLESIRNSCAYVVFCVVFGIICAYSIFLVIFFMSISGRGYEFIVIIFGLLGGSVVVT